MAGWTARDVVDHLVTWLSGFLAGGGVELVTGPTAADDPVAATITDERADAVFGALADATRRDILLRAMGGDLGVSELADRYPMSFAAVQKHVARARPLRGAVARPHRPHA